MHVRTYVPTYSPQEIDMPHKDVRTYVRTYMYSWILLHMHLHLFIEAGRSSSSHKIIPQPCVTSTSVRTYVFTNPLAFTNKAAYVRTYVRTYIIDIHWCGPTYVHTYVRMLHACASMQRCICIYIRTYVPIDPPPQAMKMLHKHVRTYTYSPTRLRFRYPFAFYS